MMIRSIPPASAHFALRPVPAPPPMIGSPASILRRKPSRISLRVRWNMRSFALSGNGMGQELEQEGRGGVGERLVVDVLVARDEPDMGMTGKPPLQRLEERPVGLGVVERPARGVESRDAAPGDHDRQGGP